MKNVAKDVELEFDRYHDRLLPYAYNILGDTMQAQDVVQDVLSRYFIEDTEHVEKPLVYLTKSVVNRSINEKKKQQRVKRQNYNGEWLPAPVYTDEGIYRDLDRNRIANFALLFLLERLSARERAVFILRESFGLAHHEISEMVGITGEHSRQLHKRARQKIELSNDKELPISDHNTALAESLSDAIVDGDMGRLKDLLSPEVSTISDGGDKVKTARKIITGHENVIKLLQAIFTKFMPPGATFDHTMLNHLPAIRFWLSDRVFRTMVLQANQGRIERVFITVNPDKLVSL